MNVLRTAIKKIMWLSIFFPLSLCAQQTEKPIVIVIPSYNNAQWYQKNLDSVLAQKYHNYRVIYIDDCSPDGTGQLVKEYLEKSPMRSKVTLICNETNRQLMSNHYRAVHMCQDHEIIVNLDGDDWLAHDQVLQRINEAYQDPNVWLTYGQFQEWPTENKGYCEPLSDKVIRNNMYRHAPWVSSHLRTFYAGLFKRVKLSDFLHDGEFYSCAVDMALMYPMLELSGGRFKCIPEVLYRYNVDNAGSLSNTKLNKQVFYGIHLRGKEKYEPFNGDVTQQRVAKNQGADLIIFSDDSAQRLYLFIRSVLGHVSGLSSATVFYHASSDQIEKEYQDVKGKTVGARFIRYDSRNTDQFKDTMLRALRNCGQQHLIFAHDTCIVMGDISLSACIEALESSYAYGFYGEPGLSIDHKEPLVRMQQQPPLAYIGNDMYAWQFVYGEQVWRNPHNFNFSLYRKKDVLNQFADMVFDSPQQLEHVWAGSRLAPESVGLFYGETKVVVCN